MQMKLIFIHTTLLCFAAGAAFAQEQPAPAEVGVGVLVMAHGGDSLWNQAVEASVAPLRERWPTEIAFGMARRETMAQALARLEAGGTRRVVVIPLFVSAESFRHRTEFFLGLRDDPPRSLGPADTIMEPVAHQLEIAINDQGLVDDAAIGDLLSIRAGLASVDPARESVFIVSHGMRSDDANGRLLDAMNRLAMRIANSIPFYQVTPFTLREDWAAAREGAEQDIRSKVVHEVSAGRTVLVVPLRLYGFGPYRDVLEGLEYRATASLLPNSIVTEWLERHAERTMFRAGWEPTATHDDP